MNKQIIRCLVIALFFLPVFYSCKKDNYIVGGSKENASMYANMTTYDVLNSLPTFDTLVQLIDAAGLKDTINQANSSFFAPTDFSIYSYLVSRTLFVQNTINQNSKFLLDSLVYYLQNNIAGTRDSLLMYLVPQPLPYSSLTNNGAIYATALAGDTAGVSYEYTKDPTLGYNTLVSSVPQIEYFTQLWYHYDIDANDPISEVPSNVGVHTRVQTSGLQTKNGWLNVLENSHVLFFYGTKQ